MSSISNISLTYTARVAVELRNPPIQVVPYAAPADYARTRGTLPTRRDPKTGGAVVSAATLLAAQIS